VLCVEVLVNMEERIMLMGDCETRLDVPIWNGVINWKHDHIWCPE